MRRAVGLSPEAGKRSSHRMDPGDSHHPKGAGSRWPSPRTPPGSRGCWPLPARARHVTFEDEVVPPGRPLARVRPAEKREKLGLMSVPPGLAPRPRAVPDYVVKYPAIRSPRQREGYKGVFQDQRAEYTELLGEVRTARWQLGGPEAAMAQPRTTSTTGRADPPPQGSRTCLSTPQDSSGVAHTCVRKRRDSAFLEKQQRCEYLKQKLTHIKARIQEYDRDARHDAVFF
ncbi:occludin/ELL domain-containing protein 1 isoform X4 [Falco rusticolus]|uniref:occludin/ELL domain-containing protein 1 isoform X3 n=1 Tax=Falco peregrinus TaxID=8954 RepID=UPI001886848D|nr:occludin/ELL domain-containing protein 1 isoform X3 [Falco peregrinus]XP_037239507.1 occludin/ELL domain-containing protein 1 isoform X4 [Falco rusticolus]XP_055564009.1 occludin/ELL domain-containing protein 1 isoform X3 [Falco cherrug]